MQRMFLFSIFVSVFLSSVAHSEQGPAVQTTKNPATIRVAGIVLKWLREDKATNYARLEPMVREAARGGAEIVCTTECFLDGYAIADKSIPLERYRSLGEQIPGGKYYERLRQLADELNITLIAGMTEALDEKRYNTAVVVAPDGQLLGKYHKQKLGHEIVRNTPGDRSPVFATERGKLGLMICADRRSRDLVGRLREGGANFLLCPSGGMFGSSYNDPVVQARSRETGRHIVFVHPAEFLVTGPDGSILSRTILGDRLLIEPDQVGTEVDQNRVFYFDVPAQPPADSSRDPLDIAGVISRPILEPDTPLREVQNYTEKRVVDVPSFSSVEDWELYADRLRRHVLSDVVLRGEAARWRERVTRVEWLDTIEKGSEYRIRKLRYEAVPGVWVPGLLYEPVRLEGLVPVVLNVNGHERTGKATPYKQIRCINQAKRGMLALNLEWFGMGQLSDAGFAHYKMNQLDLCGTSGLAPFYLALRRGLDLLLAHENADSTRVAVAGLSGGGWQTILLSSLDTRVKLANPVAGYGSFRTRTRHFSDLGDSEQTPVDLGAIADYTHLTALLAPRHALLTYNAKDNCCFKSAHTLPPLLRAAAPIYELYGKPERLQTHVNHDPGTHNFEQENREALYAAFARALAPESGSFPLQEIECADEILSSAQLDVPLPAGNVDFHGLALELAAQLPWLTKLPAERSEAKQWQRENRVLLADTVRAKDYTIDASDAERVHSRRVERGTEVVWWRLRIGTDWTLPAVEISPPEAFHTYLIVSDKGRATVAAQVEEALGEGGRVVLIDPFYFGESRISQKDFLFALLVSSVGDRALGIQASQVGAVARWLKARRPDQTLRLVADGERAGLFALVAAALETDAIDVVKVSAPFGSLKEIIERDIRVDQAPELFCFGLLQRFDMLQIAALVAPRSLEIHDGSTRAKKELAGLESWWKRLGRQRQIFR